MVGGVIAFSFMRPSSEGGFATWQTEGGLFSQRSAQQVARENEADFRGNPGELGSVPLPTVSTGNVGQNFATELTSLLTSLTNPPAPGKEPADFQPSSYAFIPQGLMTGAQETRTPLQAELYEYGNAVGASLQSFGDLHQNMPQILKDQAEDRSSALKTAALKQLADDFIGLGDDLAAMDVPSSALASHNALVAAYKDVGEKLKRIPDAASDQQFLDSINTYNSSAENLSKRLVSLVDLFSSTQTRFSSSDSGSVFTFSGSSSY